MPYDYIPEDDFICECVKNFCRDSIPSGRPSWYNHDGVMEAPFIIGIAGGSGAGKSTICNNIIKAISVPWVVNVTLDSFYKELNSEQMDKAHHNEYNFDDPNAIDHKYAVELLTNLKNGRKIEVPIYNFSNHTRMKETETIYGASIIIVDGLYALHFEKLRELIDLKIFVDTDGDIRFSRVFKRDVQSRGRDAEGIIKEYLKFIQPSFEQYIIQSKKHADMIVNWNKRDEISVSLILNYVRRELIKKGVKLRKQLKESIDTKIVIVDNLSLFYNFNKEFIVKKLVHDIKSETINDDAFYKCCESLATYLLKVATNDLNNGIFNAVDGLENHEFIGVTLLRSGKIFTNAMKKTFSKIETGLILIKSNIKTDEPELHNVKLPRHISHKKVILLEVLSRSGAALTIAIRVLLEHDVKEEDIFLVVLFVEKTSICAIKMMFPKIKMFCAEVDMFIENKKIQNNIFNKLKTLNDIAIRGENEVNYSR